MIVLCLTPYRQYFFHVTAVERGCIPSFIQTCIPVTYGYLLQSFLKYNRNFPTKMAWQQCNYDRLRTHSAFIFGGGGLNQKFLYVLWYFNVIKRKLITLFFPVNVCTKVLCKKSRINKMYVRIMNVLYNVYPINW